MTKTTLSRVLDILENHQGPLSLGMLAKQLDQPPGRTREYVEYWMRRGRIQLSAASSNCSSCGHKNGCPFTIEQPVTYQLVKSGEEDLSLSRCQKNANG